MLNTEFAFTRTATWPFFFALRLLPYVRVVNRTGLFEPNFDKNVGLISGRIQRLLIDFLET